MGDGAGAQEFTGIGLACRRGERQVFSGLDFRIGSGEALVLRGPNGSGKSSLLRVMAGLIRPVVGQMNWNDVPVTDDREAHAGRLHFVGHLDAIKPALTVSENLRFWASLRGAPAGGSSILDALGDVGLAALVDAPARYLSAGQRRRLALARLVTTPAPLWLLDEPSTGLDDRSLAAFEAILARHRAAGGMVALATHTEIALPGARELRLDEFTRGLVMDEMA
jgi:heme exporter protein A